MTAVKRRIQVAISLLPVILCWHMVGNAQLASAQKDSQLSHPATVVLTIDFGDGMQKRYPKVPWKRGMTVLHALEWASRHPRGIKFDGRGRGATKLVSRIDDLKNGSVADKNWIFRVNGKLGDRSCGVLTVKAKDSILWKFEPYQ